MAEDEKEKPELTLAKSAPSEPARKRLLPKRKFDFNKERLVGFILDNLKTDLEDREERMSKRMVRNQKLMGWLPEKDFPWEGCANPWVPAMRIADLKMRGALENALKSVRPMMSSKARQKRNAEKQEAIDQLLDFQFFIENYGEKIIDNTVAHFTQDETVYLTVRYVKETQTLHDTRIFPALDPEQDVAVQLMELLGVIYPQGKRQAERALDDKGYEWEVIYTDDITNEPAIAKVCFYEQDDYQILATIAAKAVTHEGPVIDTPNFEDIVYPIRSANLQPPSDTNPDGAPYYNKFFTFNLDVCKRRMEDGTYDQLTEEDFKVILESESVIGKGDESDEPKVQKDILDGVEVSRANKREDRQGVLHYGRYDVDGDGIEEDVIVWVAREAKKIMKVAILTEHFPGLPIRRPIVHDSFIPNPDRVIGQSQAEILESLGDMQQTMMAQHIDYGTLTNTPFGLYRAASGLKGEPMNIEPGVLFPVDDPQRDLVFPQWPTKDSGFALNTTAVIQQWIDKISVFGATSYGSVPQGKASALRTTGTTMALLAPGEERTEMILRRLFHLFTGVYQLMHRLNRRFLPREKEIRVQGMQEEGMEGYATINRDNIDAEIDFEFLGSMINANKQMLQQELKEAMAVLVSPLAMAMGVISPAQIYQLFRDYLTALNQDPDKYMMRPNGVMSGPKLFATEVISAILADEIPRGQPKEAPEEHLFKLMAYMQSPESVFMSPLHVMVLKTWITQVQSLINQQRLMLAAMSQGGGGQDGEEKPGGTPTTVSEEGTGLADNAPVGEGELIDESVGMKQ